MTKESVQQFIALTSFLYLRNHLFEISEEQMDADDKALKEFFPEELQTVSFLKERGPNGEKVVGLIVSDWV